jgi:hypothetical protein
MPGFCEHGMIWKMHKKTMLRQDSRLVVIARRCFASTTHSKLHSALLVFPQGDPQAFADYLSTYKNTICGRHPIAVLLHVSLCLCEGDRLDS